MPRMPIVYIKGSIYYITSYGYGKNLFTSHEDYLKYVSLIKEYKPDDLKIFSYALLPDHLHLLLETQNAKNLSQFMHNVTSLYTKYFNSQYQKKGHLFKGRYKAVLVEKDSYLLRLTRYIHLHSKKSGVVDEPKAYPYSSYPYFLNILHQGAKIVPREQIQEVFNCLKGEEKKEKAYENFVNKADEKELEFMHNAFYRKRVFGSDEFIKKVNEAIEIRTQKKENIISKGSPAGPPHKALFRQIALAIIFLLVVRVYYIIPTGEIKTVTETKIIEKKVIIPEDLTDFVWIIELIPASPDKPEKRQKDELRFVDGKFISTLMDEKFSSSNYTRTIKDDGTIIWETMQTNEEGAVATWYGEWRGDVIKGLLSFHPAEGKTSRDFSFVSVRRIKSG